MTPARRLLLSADDLALLAQRTSARLPPGFRLSGQVEGPLPALLAHPALAADLAVLSRPELAVLVRASTPGLSVTACLAVSGPRGAGLLRTGDTAVQLSAYAAADLGAELARTVPASLPARGAPQPAIVPLDRLLTPSGSRLHGRQHGALRGVVVRGSGAVVGSVEWVWDGGRWTAVHALPSRAGRPMVRLDPVGPSDLARCLAPLVAAAA